MKFNWQIIDMYPEASELDPKLFHFMFEPEFGHRICVDVPIHYAFALNIFEAWNIAREQFIKVDPLSWIPVEPDSYSRDRKQRMSDIKASGW